VVRGPTVQRERPAGPQVVVVGDVMVDVLVEVRSALAHASDTPSRIATAPGGSAANLAVWLSRAGARVLIAASVGRDPFGQASLHALAREGVDTSGVASVDRSTGIVVALVEPDGQRSMLTDRGANLWLSQAGVEAALGRLERGGHVHVSGYALLDDASRHAGLHALARAREAGATRSADASSAGPLEEVGPSRFLEWVGGVGSLFCNLDEAKLLSGQPDARSAAGTLAATVGEAIVTDGARGAVVARGSDVLAVPAVDGSTATDTTGAGDAFNGTYLARRLAGDSVSTATSAATAAAASAIATSGARSWDYSLE
jgi:sugar/nucleoside kinase (ribokinase family)